MKYITEAIEDYIQGLNVKYNEGLFERVLDFIMDLDPEILSDEQLEDVENILDTLELYGEEEEVTEIIKARRSSPEKRREARQYWRKNKSKIKVKRKKFRKSAEGRKRKRKRGTMAKSNRTPTGRKMMTYNK